MSRRKNVPTDIREMLLAITRVFYEPTETAILNILICHNYLSEQELVDISEFDFQMLRSSLNKLRKDKLVDMRMQVSTDENGKSINKSYFFINFKQALNSFMYRLESCYKKLEEAQRQNISSGDYCCTECSQTYSDLDIMTMYNFERECILCGICGGVVESIEDKEKRHNAREEIARFNTKIRNPFVALFEKCNKYLLTADMIRPDFKDPTTNNDSVDVKSNNVSSNRVDEILVNLNSNATWSDSFNIIGKEAKENPAWISSNVANNFISNNQSENNVILDKNAASQDDNITLTMAPGRVPGAITTVNSSTPVTDIMSVLLANEYCVENSLKFYDHLKKDLHYKPPPKNLFKVTISGRIFDIWNVTEEMFESMSKEEINQFQFIGKRLHEYCYDSITIC